MTTLKQVRVLPKHILFAHGVDIQPNQSLNGDELVESINKSLQQFTKIEGPSNNVYELVVETTGSLIGGFLECLPRQNPTLSIGNVVITSINLKDGSAIHRGLLDEYDVVIEAMHDYNINFKVSRETGNYTLSAKAVEVESLTVHVSFNNENLKSMV